MLIRLWTYFVLVWLMEYKRDLARSAMDLNLKPSQSILYVMVPMEGNETLYSLRCAIILSDYGLPDMSRRSRIDSQVFTLHRPK